MCPAVVGHRIAACVYVCHTGTSALSCRNVITYTWERDIITWERNNFHMGT